MHTSHVIGDKCCRCIYKLLDFMERRTALKSIGGLLLLPSIGIASSSVLKKPVLRVAHITDVHLKSLPIHYCLGNHDIWWNENTKADPFYGKKYAMDKVQLGGLTYA